MDATERKGNNRMLLLLIAGIPVTVILVATWLWYYVARGDLDLVAVLGTSNSGELVQPPRSLEPVELTGTAGASHSYSELGGKWTFLIPGGALCAEVCESTLYTTRQIHLALGGDFNRIQRLYISANAPGDTVLDIQQLSDGRPAPPEFSQLLDSEHDGLRPLTLAAGPFEALLPEFFVDPSTWYLVDPAGWIMMSYNSEVSYKGVMSDLKFLLKNSSG
jgi:cytochrome oxidase Cu insertion factor (SCO1/SenC/PrrC family)